MWTNQTEELVLATNLVCSTDINYWLCFLDGIMTHFFSTHQSRTTVTEQTHQWTASTKYYLRVMVLTTGNWIFAVCPIVCREPKLGHTAKETLAVCLKWSSRQTTGTRQRALLPCAAERDTRQTITTRQKFSNRNGFTSLPCANGQNTRQTFGTWQIFWNRNGSPVLPCVVGWHTANSKFCRGFFFCQVPEPKHTAKYWRKN